MIEQVGNCRTRRASLHAVVAGLIAVSFLADAPAQSKKRPEAKTGKSPQLALQDFGLCYTRPLTLKECSAFKEVVTEPGHYPRDDFYPPSDNAIAYVSLAAANLGNQSQETLRKHVNSVDGWLRDSKGEIIKYDSQKEKDVWLFDLRKGEVGEALKTQLGEIRIRNYKGIYFDSLDMLAQLEMNDPQRYKGLRKAAVDFIEDVSTNVDNLQGYGKKNAKSKAPKAKKSSKGRDNISKLRFIVAGGISNPGGVEGTDPMEALAPHVDGFVCIDQATENGEIRKEDASEFTLSRLRTAIKAAGAKKLTFYPLETGAPPGVNPASVSASKDSKSKELIKEVNAHWKKLAGDESLKDAAAETKGSFEVLMPYCALDPVFRDLRQYTIEDEKRKAERTPEK